MGSFAAEIGARKQGRKAEMSEFDELVASPGVFMGGRFGPDGRIAEHKSASLYVANPASAAMAEWFCAAITMMFRSMAHVVDLMDQSGFNQTSWLPVHTWTYSGGDYVIAVHGDRFIVAEGAKLGVWMSWAVCCVPCGLKARPV
jgi:roadblock/LC7 domain-containing protein